MGDVLIKAERWFSLLNQTGYKVSKYTFISKIYGATNEFL